MKIFRFVEDEILKFLFPSQCKYFQEQEIKGIVWQGEAE